MELALLACGVDAEYPPERFPSARVEAEAAGVEAPPAGVDAGAPLDDLL